MTTPAPPLDPSASRPRASALVWGPILAVATGAAAWWCTGLVEEADPVDADFLWEPNRALTDHRGLVVMAAAAVGALALAALVRCHRRGALPGWRVVQVVVLVGLGTWLGFGYGVVTAPTTGANIGGGLVLLATPLIVIGAFVAVGLLEAAGRRRTGRVGREGAGPPPPPHQPGPINR